MSLGAPFSNWFILSSSVTKSEKNKIWENWEFRIASLRGVALQKGMNILKFYNNTMKNNQVIDENEVKHAL